MMIELTNVRRGRIFAVPYRANQAGMAYAIPSGCVVERLNPGQGSQVPECVPEFFALDVQGKPASPNAPREDVFLLPLSGIYRTPSGEAAAVYGATVHRIN
ncbi:hypothetical protein [Singulisphaera acidiphila]|uniref:Uncharacterized protein n=1 Tax=Singulisphaera acidiphila (strain ATCC BAA-1392 / DSM 18658 / VKM B-2454 / MOB10) TaxID=886293 RepID=L0D6G1_SINAD|nr:hypothetical protein [Singulisphaera acidiphila]AGA24989.1 hypothetical protein Sinac_0565 [Singulisphaera acidiphila DSM 18658]